MGTMGLNVDGFVPNHTLCPAAIPADEKEITHERLS